MEWCEALLLKFRLPMSITGCEGAFMKLTKCLLVIGLLPVLSACNLQEEESVIVAVYPSRQQCGIEKQMMKCGEVAAYIHDTLKIQSGRRVVVSAVGIDPLPKDDRSLGKIAETIRAQGYTDVRTANFDMK